MMKNSSTPRVARKGVLFCRLQKPLFRRLRRRNNNRPTATALKSATGKEAGKLDRHYRQRTP